jgi:hypothetical protein
VKFEPDDFEEIAEIADISQVPFGALIRIWALQARDSWKRENWQHGKLTSEAFHANKIEQVRGRAAGS